MARIFSKCEWCKKRCVFAYKRTYFHKMAKLTKGQIDICGTCHKQNKKIFTQMNDQLP